jgi:hypothetical protein
LTKTHSVAAVAQVALAGKAYQVNVMVGDRTSKKVAGARPTNAMASKP